MKQAWWLALPAALALTGYATFPGQAEKKVTKATAVIHATKGQTVRGVVKFESTADGCKISLDLAGLTPGKHGFHIHEFGDCNCDDGKCAGGHFNPAGKKHGGPGAAERHVGDLGNIVADDQGMAKAELVDKLVALSGGSSVVGRAVIIHEKEDDLATDPTGNAGGRIGIGVIGIAKEE